MIGQPGMLMVYISQSTEQIGGKMNVKVSRKWLISLSVTLGLVLLLLAIGSVLAQEQGPESEEAAQPQGGVSVADAVNSRISYQGMVEESGSPVNGTRDITFNFYTNETCSGVAVYDTTENDVPITDGLFSVDVDIGQNYFWGEGLWLEVEVDGTSIGCEEILPVPYALSLRPGAEIAGEPTAWEGWVLKVDVNGAYPLGAGIQGSTATGSAIRGEATGGYGVYGYTEEGYAVYGRDEGAENARGYGGFFSSANGVGIYGYSDAQSRNNNMYAPGVYGRSHYGVGVYGKSDGGDWPAIGVRGEGSGTGVSGGSDSGTGVYGSSDSGTGVYGYSTSYHGVYGESKGDSGHGGHFANTHTDLPSNQAGVWAGSYWGNVIEGHEVNASGNSVERVFRVDWMGNVYADGRYYCGETTSCYNSGTGADVAERIDAMDALESGDVVEIVPDHPGYFRRARTAFSRAVAGVVSTKPAMTMGNDFDPEKEDWNDDRPLLALVGVVPVKASAENGPIVPGDLLVASSTPGHAMKADAAPPVGTVIGKALEGLGEGTGVIQMLVMLR
jgi:hypothetical protein